MKVLQKRAKLLFATLSVLGLVIAASPSMATAQDTTSLQAMQKSRGSKLHYVALGDSVAAGAGLTGVPPSANFEDSLCGRSELSYPHEVHKRFGEKLQESGHQLKLNNLGCTGAHSEQLTHKQMINGIKIKPQLKKAFKKQPSLITMTLGANDTKWNEFIASCFSATTCNTPQNTALVDGYIASMKTNLSEGMKEIRARSGYLPPLVIATGYYNPVSELCVNNNFTLAEAAWIQGNVYKINAAIKKATQDTHWFARYAPVNFTGHDICSGDSWVQAQGEAAPLHPTARGQKAIADSVLSVLELR